ncbi:spore coat U domain-containing protein [Buttiauxella selenatireducens]|uniref:Spore coat U domain-containing protein n=1 Tax=Buttiauxella selenatireducens TaxID=3073902 RepID=A0ABY9SIB3_9ENTR|nr:spore coat U domain-containing protein [Buttiauxella sp. R73]WMY76161.1 spore coat U domain-containing protein [Buttiauxella sp. R73]
MIIGRGLGVLLAIMLLQITMPAHADCRLSGVNGSFGSQSSFVVGSTVQNTTASISVDCDKVLSLLTADSIKLTYLGATPAVTGVRGLLRRTDDTSNPDNVPVVVCVQSGCAGSSEIQVGGSYTWSGTILLGLLTSQRYTLPIYLRTVAGQNVSAGPYSVALNFRIDWNVCNLGVAVCLAYQTGSGSPGTTVSLTVSNDCSTITAPAVNFDSAPLVQNFKSVSQSIAVTCTKGSTYTVGVSNGANVSGNVRRMKSGNNFMSYEIYKSNGTDRWGSLGAERWASSASSGLSSDGLLRNYNYVAKVLTTQTTPPAGSYTDTLVVDVAF